MGFAILSTGSLSSVTRGVTRKNASNQCGSVTAVAATPTRTTRIQPPLAARKDAPRAPRVLAAPPGMRELARGRKTAWRTCASEQGGSDADNSTTSVRERDNKEEDGEGSEDVGTDLAPIFLGTFLVAGLALGIVFKDDINGLIEGYVGQFGDGGLEPPSLAQFGVIYVGLELLAVPALPLTMTAGALYGATQGTLMISVAATAACTISFLIARYLAQERALKLADKYPIYQAINAAVSKDGLKIIALLRFSPLLPFAVGNYLYGLTSVSLRDYMLGSWIGMLPGCTWYVLAGSIGRSTWTSGGDLDVSSQIGSLGLALGAAASLSAGGYAAKLIKDSLDEVKSNDQAIDVDTESINTKVIDTVDAE